MVLPTPHTQKDSERKSAILHILEVLPKISEICGAVLRRREMVRLTSLIFCYRKIFSTVVRTKSQPSLHRLQIYEDFQFIVL
jgi:hypothetical protein